LATDEERSPIRRLRLLRVLAEHDDTLHTAELSGLAGLREMATGTALVAFARAGLLSYRTAPTYDLQTVYRVAAPVVFTRVGNSAMRDAIADYLNARLGDTPVEVAREEIEAHLLAADVRWQERASLRDQVQKAMKAMVAAGRVEAVSAHYGRTHSQIAMDEAQRGFIATMVRGVTDIAAGDPAAVAAGRAAGRAILDDPDRVRPLIRRAFAASKLSSDPRTRDQKFREVQAAVGRCPGSTSVDLLQELGSGYNKALLANTLASLVRDGLVRGERQPDGPYKRWFPVEGG
jgi:hypothetical protein